MQPTKKHQELAKKIDAFVKTIEQHGGGDAELLQQSYPYMPTLKELLDTTTHDQLDSLCETYQGFYRFAKLIELLAQGIQDGTIKVPPVN